MNPLLHALLCLFRPIEFKSAPASPDVFFAPIEIKFAEGAPVGEFSGYAAVFGNADSHGDVILPGAFADSLAERKVAGRPVPMHVMHRGMFGGDGLPVGVWTNIAEDDKGLHVTGKISGVDTDAGKLLHARVKDGALGGLSIGYRVRPGGSVLGKKAGEPKRTLKALDLHEISLVDDPSNALSRVQEVKAAGDGTTFEPDVDAAIDALAQAIIMQDKIMQGYSYSGTAKDAALLMDALRTGYLALTGERAPDGLNGWTKAVLTKREFEKVLREECGLSRSQASDIANRRVLDAEPREEGSDKAKNEAKSVLDELGTSLAGFKLPKL